MFVCGWGEAEKAREGQAHPGRRLHSSGWTSVLRRVGGPHSLLGRREGSLRGKVVWAVLDGLRVWEQSIVFTAQYTARTKEEVLRK